MKRFYLLKKTFLILKIFTFCIGVVFAKNDLPAGVSVQNLLAYYSLDGNADDISGNGQSGTINGNPIMTLDRNGNADKAYLFNGTSDYINIPGYLPNNENFTVSAWFKLENVDPNTMDYLPILGNHQNAPFLGYYPKSKTVINLRQYAATPQYAGNSQYLSWVLNTPLENGNWHHMVMSVNQQSLIASLYLDGVLISSVSIGSEGYTHGNGALVAIGKDYASFWSGGIDDVGIWNRALGEDEIENMFQKMSSSNSGSGVWKVNGNDIYYNDGNVGIGTTNPQINLAVAGTKMVLGGNNITGNYNMDQAVFELQSTSGSFFKMNGGESNLQFNASQNGNNLFSEGKDLSFYTYESSSSPSERMRITTDGKMGIGTSTVPSGFKVAIDGKMILEGVKVQNSTEWADYVFEKDYDLKSLNEVELFINKNKHLPNVPSAKEVNEKGIDLNEMDATLLRKIEELTLYVIEQEKRARQQNMQVTKLIYEVKKLKKENKELLGN